MTTKCMLLVAGAIGGTLAVAPLATASDLTPAVVTNLSGTLRVQQDVPCADNVDQTTPVIGGRLELSPAEGYDIAGNKLFALTRVNVQFAGFSVTRSCLLISETRTYSDITVQEGNATPFVAVAGAPGVYAVTIPKDNFSIWEASIVDGNPENGFKQPRDDVTGIIDLAHGTVQMHVVIKTSVRFQGGCTAFGCIIDETRDGLLTADVAGTIAFPDADQDGVPDRADNCRLVANPDQTPVPTPVVTPPGPVTLHSCIDHTIGAAAGSDVCDGGPVTVTSNAPGTFSVGTNIVTWTAEDAQHRTASADQTITVIDTTKPTFSFVPPDIAVGNCGPVAIGTATAVDDCAGTPTVTNDAPGAFFVGTTTVTWTATDAASNSTTATQKVTVTDTVPPAVTCTPTNPVGTSFIVSGSDACGAPVLTLGSYVIANGEQIKIQETGQPGVRLQNVISSDGIRKFLVGKGEAVIVATDGSNNVSTAICR
jgi:hypothetical protein